MDSREYLLKRGWREVQDGWRDPVDKKNLGWFTTDGALTIQNARDAARLDECEAALNLALPVLERYLSDFDQSGGYRHGQRVRVADALNAVKRLVGGNDESH